MNTSLTVVKLQQSLFIVNYVVTNSQLQGTIFRAPTPFFLKCVPLQFLVTANFFNVPWCSY